MQTCQLLRIRSTTLYSANTAFRVLSNSKTPCCECSSYQENCAFSSVTCFTCTLSPGANVLSQKSKARVSCVRIRHLSELPDAAAPANLCSTDTNCRSVSIGFALGYFCQFILPYLYAPVLHNILEDFISRVSFCVSHALLAYNEGVYKISNTDWCLQVFLSAKPQVCWSQLSFVISSCKILVTFLLE